MTTDFLIIGAGAIGLTSAQTLLKAGYRVTLVESGAVGQEASWAGGGILSPLCSWDYQESVTGLAHRSMGMFAETAAMLKDATGVDTEYRRCGMLLLPPYPAQQATQWCAQHQFSCEPVAISDYLLGQHESGMLLPEVAQVRNPRLLNALRKHVEMLGGEILEQHEVKQLEITGDRVSAIHTTQGRLSADAYIVAAGAWSKSLLGEHALNIEIRPIRGQILLFKFEVQPFSQVLLKENLYFIPRNDGHVLVGSTLEDVGFDKSTTTEAHDDLMARICEVFPEWAGLQPVRHWAGFRPGSPDNIPTIGRHPQVDNLYINSGHFRYGVTMSLASAELLYNEIAGNPQPIPVEDYRWQ